MGGDLYSEQREVIVEMKGISRNYTTGSNIIEALRDINLYIKQGEFIGIMGPSASGKSTLLNLLGCLDTPSKGEYHLKGRNIQKLSRTEKAKIRNQVFGFVFQAFNLLPELDVYHNVALPLKYGKIPKRQWEGMIMEALEAVGLKDVANRYPDQLSGGQQQRVAIARALVNKPDVILADEPTGSLDTATSGDIMEELRKLKEQTGRTIVVITHDARIAYAICIDEQSRDVVKEYLVNNNLPAAPFVDHKKTTKWAFNANIVPTVYIIDQNGVISARAIGWSKDLEQYINKEIEEGMCR